MASDDSIKRGKALGIVYDNILPPLIERLYAPSVKEVPELLELKWKGCDYQFKRDLKTSIESYRINIESETHTAGKKPNQDAAGHAMVKFLDNSNETKTEYLGVAVVADGISSSSFSEFGALIATQWALKSCVEFIHSCSILNEINPQFLIEYFSKNSFEYRELFNSTFSHTHAILGSIIDDDGYLPNIKEEAARLLRAMEPVDHLATTLIVLINKPDETWVIAWGNGFAAKVNRNKDLMPLWFPNSNKPLANFLSGDNQMKYPSTVNLVKGSLSNWEQFIIGSDGIPNTTVLEYAWEALDKPHGNLSPWFELLSQDAELCSDNMSLASISFS